MGRSPAAASPLLLLAAGTAHARTGATHGPDGGMFIRVPNRNPRASGDSWMYAE